MHDRKNHVDQSFEERLQESRLVEWSDINDGLDRMTAWEVSHETDRVGEVSLCQRESGDDDSAK